MPLERGKLILNKKGRLLIEVDGKLFNPAAGEISQRLLDNLKYYDGKQVEFERVGGQPKKVREVGGVFVPPLSTVNAGTNDQRRQRRGGGAQTGGPREGWEQAERDGLPRQPDFHNPYNFVPAPPRKIDDPDLGDQRPVDQSAFLADRYSGWISVKMTAKTPLLVPDTEGALESPDGHKTFPLRVGDDGKPLIPASSIRGMLRTAYEAVTNSRFGRFSESHKRRLKFRQNRPPFSKVHYEKSAWDLLHDSLLPAAAINQLSPADRVFGWVKVDVDTEDGAKGERVAARGLLRVGPVRCTSNTADAVEQFGAPGIPLAILSTPKPQQGRFYVARSPNGEAQENGLSKQKAGYSANKGLRGRKVYPHHRSLPDGHWRDPMEDRTQQPLGTPAHYQEYRRPRLNGKEQRDDQNCSVLGWVKPGAEFNFKLHVQNLSPVELGALVWLLELPDDCFLRLGGGKPLGFGSVRLEIESCDLRAGRNLRERYGSWFGDGTPGDPRQLVVEVFRQAVTRAYPLPSPSAFDEVPFIRAFLRACKGHGDNLPIHYPRATADGRAGPPSPDGESFKWFVANDDLPDARYALADLANDPGLPTLRAPGRRAGGNRPSRGGGGQDQRRARRR